MVVKWKDVGTAFSRLLDICRFSIDIIGKFSKMELYFAWKLLDSADLKFEFFAPIATPKKKSLLELKGIAWDLSMFRMSETMAG